MTEHRYVADCDNSYCVGDDGTIWSRRRPGKPGKVKGLLNSWHLLDGVTHKGGYIRVYTNINGKIKLINLHVLILETFIGPCPKGMQCRHLNGNPSDNRLVNLCWGTRLENAKDKNIHGSTSRGSKHGTAKLNEEDVINIRLAYKQGITQTSLAIRYNIRQTNISEIVNYKTWKHV